MIMWECIEAKRYLSSLVRDELPEDVKTEVDLHVSDCVDCSNELELIKNLFALRVVAPAELSSEIKRTLRTEILEVETLTWKRFLPAAAVAAFLVSASLIDRVLLLPEVSLLEQDFFVNVWPSEDYDLAGSLVLDNFSEESLNLLFEEIR
ncbi:MAG TPA: hypothetical protein EYQ69_06460 [Gemmatimonadetes bacterium]|nr:hypothetical protein [Gemmatimonadota bacterium]